MFVSADPSRPVDGAREALYVRDTDAPAAIDGTVHTIVPPPSAGVLSAVNVPPLVVTEAASTRTPFGTVSVSSTLNAVLWFVAAVPFVAVTV